ncbi:hypothetical protein Patl1_06119 [Pistacia atlantica]|uniref:Uncharacterized protein n=1 Tax=Pistacia atlantica TaxID=434234 RepID=A0ACC1BVN4_9ROSI|nr:hypothetical protein Patl1_06119 [Pistacia atlantica]
MMKNFPPVVEVVTVLSEESLSHFVANNRYVMVAFLASWSPACRKLAPEYAEASRELKGEVVLAKVYADKEKGLEKNGQRLRWVFGVYNITTAEQLEEEFMSKSTIVLAFLDSLQGLEIEELVAASKLHPDVIFYQTASANVARRFQHNPEIKRPALILLEKESQHLSHFSGPFTKSEIAYFSFGKNFIEDKLSGQPVTISETEFFLAIRRTVAKFVLLEL